MRKVRPPQALRDGDTVRVGATIYHMTRTATRDLFDVFRNDKRVGTVSFALGQMQAKAEKNKATTAELIAVATLLYDERGNPT